MYSAIFTVTDSLRFDIDSHRLTSERISLIHWLSRPRVSNRGSSCLNIKETDEDALRCRLIVVYFAVELSVVLPCARCRGQSAITLFLSL